MQVMVQSKLKPDEVAGTLESLDAVYEELEAARPVGLRYTTYQLDDGVTFVAIVEFADGPEVLQGLPAFQRYRESLDDKCDQAPVMSFLHEVGSYTGPDRD